MMKETIMVICAHDDDDSVGVMGTILKYIDEGKRIVKIVFSYGEGSQPHLKEKIITKTRVKETRNISRSIGIKDTIYFGLADGKVKEEIENKDIRRKLKKLIKKYNPSKILIPTGIDPHPDHRAVHNLVKEVVEEIDFKGSLLAFEVWNISNQNLPVVYEDITPYFKKKIEIMKQFKSQLHFMYPLMIPVYFRARKYGRKYGCKYAEKFYKLK